MRFLNQKAETGVSNLTKREGKKKEKKKPTVLALKFMQAHNKMKFSLYPIQPLVFIFSA